MSFVPLNWNNWNAGLITIEEWRRDKKGRLIHVNIEDLIDEIIYERKRMI